MPIHPPCASMFYHPLALHKAVNTYYIVGEASSTVDSEKKFESRILVEGLYKICRTPELVSQSLIGLKFFICKTIQRQLCISETRI